MSTGVGGWLNHPFYANQESLNNQLSVMWPQIANHFRDYDHRLLFARTKEVSEGDYGTPTQEFVDVQNSFNQTFVTALRATGGNNANRYPVVQGFNTKIDHRVNFADIPTDTVANRLMMEVYSRDQIVCLGNAMTGDRHRFLSQDCFRKKQYR